MPQMAHLHGVGFLIQTLSIASSSNYSQVCMYHVSLTSQILMCALCNCYRSTSDTLSASGPEAIVHTGHSVIVVILVRVV